MPVHRPPGVKRGGVYAYSAELDAWLAQASGLENDDLAAHELPPHAEPKFSHFWLMGALGILVLLACIFLGYFIGQKKTLSTLAAAGTSVKVQALTFRRGFVRSARFRPDGRNVVYGASWEESPVTLYETSLERPESSPLRASSAQLLAVSRSSTLAVLLNARALGPFMQVGTLAVQGLYESRPEPLSPNVGWADWSPDGSTLVYTVINRNGGSWVEAYSLEQHQTHRIYPRNGLIANEWYSHIRYSPNGKQLGFESHVGLGSAGHVVVFDPSSGSSIVSAEYANISGLAWPPEGKEVWFTAAEKGYNRGIYALDQSKHTRLIYQAPIALTLQDVSSAGDALVTREFAYSALFAKNLQAPANKETELSLFDWSVLGDISADGKMIALVESGDAVRKSGVYLRGASGGPVAWLGDAREPLSISPDGNSVVALTGEACPRVVLLSSNRRSEVLTGNNLCVGAAFWVPDGKRIVFDGGDANHKSRCYLQAVNSKTMQPFTAEGSHCFLVSPDGKDVLSETDGEYFKVALDSAHPPTKVKFNPAYTPLRWLSGDWILTDDGKLQGVTIYDLASGQAGSSDPIALPAGVESLSEIKVSADRQTYVYSGYRMRSDLYLIRNLR